VDRIEPLAHVTERILMLGAVARKAFKGVEHDTSESFWDATLGTGHDDWAVGVGLWRKR
jgi:hypothetical protein